MPAVQTRNIVMSATQFAPYRVEAYNTAHASENKIHDGESTSTVT